MYVFRKEVKNNRNVSGDVSIKKVFILCLIIIDVKIFKN